MRRTVTITYPAAPDTVATMLADPGFQRGRVAALGLEDVRVDVRERDGGFAATVSGTVPADRIPPAARRLVRSPLSFRVTESWGPVGAQDHRDGGVKVDVSGAPVRAVATSTMRADDAGAVVTLNLSLDVSVPFVGRALEDKALGYVEAVVADERRRAEAWIASH